jgi:uncharacterized UPF0160 family protein
VKIVTHNGSFHADDVFAVATLLRLYPDATVVRTRDKEKIQEADIVVDVGHVHDVGVNRFDHHQPGGAGVRDNGIPYAAFGLVWKEYGEKVSKDRSIAGLIEETLVMPIDAVDNGVDISTPLYPRIKEFNISGVISSFLPESDYISPDVAFFSALDFAQGVLDREIKNAQTELEDKRELVTIAKKNQSGFLVLDRFMRGKDVLIDFPGILYVVYPGRETWGDTRWYVKGVKKNFGSMEMKKLLPQSWAGKDNQELASISGVQDASFCHKGRHLAAAFSKEGAVKLAEIALNA